MREGGRGRDGGGQDGGFEAGGDRLTGSGQQGGAGATNGGAASRAAPAAAAATAAARGTRDGAWPSRTGRRRLRGGRGVGGERAQRTAGRAVTRSCLLQYSTHSHTHAPDMWASVASKARRAGHIQKWIPSTKTHCPLQRAYLCMYSTVQYRQTPVNEYVCIHNVLYCAYIPFFLVYLSTLPMREGYFRS